MSCCSRLSFLLIILGLSISCCGAVEEITKCGLRCSQGLQCKSKNMTFSDPDRPCRKRLSSLPSEIVEDLKIFTVLKCIKERQCSTHLKVKGTLIINEHIRGVEMCSISMNTLQYQCVVVKFNKQAYKKFTARSVEIEYDCFRAAVAEYTYVTLTTIPYYCDVFIKQVHQVGDCTNKEVGRNIPTCIAGKLDYVIHKTQKILSVQVSDFVEDYAYNVRLCHKWFICEDLGINALIKVQDSKEVTLPYSQLLPCLCIEGWSVLPDARRVQLCPFKNYTAELWNGITYDHVTQELAWELACPVEVGVNLCWMTGSNDHCIDLQDSFYKVQQKVRYSRVDPHPRLCVKFTTDEGFWVRCPFASGYIPGMANGYRILCSDSVLQHNVQIKFYRCFLTVYLANCNHCDFIDSRDCDAFYWIHVLQSSSSALQKSVSAFDPIVQKNVCGHTRNLSLLKVLPPTLS
ncbi:putative interleukin-17 receptor E-like isoform X3 [Carcharodon carcharias]|uniref:putative interleukin-17 receptor E-like isoform X3 n=1 Tax=Carcharodon carcharias TaxID=13397 RepID=UPI001B7F3C44|nr:putative interleukin-17 receptor E-like isoform X3 [Carcharodon carcharias]